MTDITTGFIPGTLLSAIRQRTQLALANHALQPIETRQIVLPDCGVDFLVRVVSSLARKDHYRNRSESEPEAENPFLPYDADLYVCDVSTHHVCLLNKFYVIENHALLVSREFEHQENLLTEADFAAWFSCLREFNSLGFYNGGKVAGASQTHKHMQLISLPLSNNEELEFPFAGLLQELKCQFTINERDFAAAKQCGLPFKHAVIALNVQQMPDLQSAAAYLYKCYNNLLSAVGIGGINIDGDIRQSTPYNLLISKQWMWLVPRSHEFYQDISVNALGFAGSLFVRESAQLELVRSSGPMEVLRAVSMP